MSSRREIRSRARVQPVVPRSSLPPVELVLDGPVLPNLSSLKVRRDDKVVFDQLKAWWSIREGRELSQCEAFTFLLSAALESEDARLPVTARRASR